MNIFKIEKVLSQPTTLEANTIYLVKKGSDDVFNIVVSDKDGAAVFTVDKGAKKYSEILELPDLTLKANLVGGKVPVSELSINSTNVGYSGDITDATTVAQALQTLWTSVTGAVAGPTLTANAIVVTNNDGKIVVHPSVSSAEVGYLDGVSSNVQEQLNGKQTKIEGAASTIVYSNLKPGNVVITDESGKVATSSEISLAELNLLKGLTTTKTISTQLSDKRDATDATISTFKVPAITGLLEVETPLQAVLTDILTRLQNNVVTDNTQQW